MTLHVLPDGRVTTKRSARPYRKSERRDSLMRILNTIARHGPPGGKHCIRIAVAFATGSALVLLVARASEGERLSFPERPSVSNTRMSAPSYSVRCTLGAALPADRNCVSRPQRRVQYFEI